MTPLNGLDIPIGMQMGVSNWRTLSQNRIDQFADATEDMQFIHIDPVRAQRETDFGGTIAPGFLTLSFVSALASDVIEKSPTLKSLIIVAVDRVRFVSPVRAGKRVRATFALERQHGLPNDRMMLQTNIVIEIEDEKKPALTCSVSWIATFGAPDEICENPGSRAEPASGARAV